MRELYLGDMSNILVSRFKDIPIPRQSLPDFIFQRIAKNGDLVALIEPHTGRQFTYNELVERVKRAASGLRHHGVNKGDVVLIISPNDIDIGVAFLALASLGAITTTADPASTPNEVKFQLEDTGASFVICAESTIERVPEALNDSNKVFTFGHVADDVVTFEDVILDGAYRELPDQAEIDPEDVILILYSSGTTGTPKGVMITHYMVVSFTLAWNSPDVCLAQDAKMSGSECLIMSLPFRHTMGLIIVFLESLFCGSQLIIPKEIIFEDYLDLIHRYKATELHMLPNMIALFAKHPLLDQYDLSHVHTIVGTGNVLDQTILELLRTRFSNITVRQAYGMTEMAAPVIEPRIGLKKHSTGALISNVKMKAVDLETSRELGPNEKGELYFKCPHIMKGYLNRPEATKEVLDQDGWLRTGDLGFYDEDGNIFVVGRIKEIIKCDGFQVPPAELECLLLTLPGVADAAVIGVPDEIAGELPKAFIVKESGYNISANQIQHFVKENIVPSKHLRGGVQFVDSIPKTGTGKIIRRLLNEKANVQ